MSRIDLQALLRYVCHLITEIDGNFVIILNFISLRGLSISMVFAYIRRHTSVILLDKTVSVG